MNENQDTPKQESKSSFSSILELLPKLTNYLVGATLLCYISGFVISNMYLGSLGVINLDVLRARYILVGLLFLLYVFAIIFLVYPLRILLRIKQGEIKNLFYFFVRDSLFNATVVYVAVILLAYLTGSDVDSSIVSNQKFTESLVYPIISIVFWMFITICLAFLYVLYKNNKIFLKLTGKQLFAAMFSSRKLIKRIFLIVSFGFYICLSVLFIYLYSYIFMGRIMDFSFNAINPGWVRFIGGIVTNYVFFVLLGFPGFLSSRMMNRDTYSYFLKNFSMKPIALYMMVFCLVMVVPVYTFAIYPNLPQNIGGGHNLLIQVSVSDADLQTNISDPNNQIFLLDRTSESVIVQIVDKNTQEYNITEIKNSLIKTITYQSEP